MSKLYYKIGEACRALDIQPYVLRYWETEFAALSPSKSKSGQRVYAERELAIIRRIKELLYDEGYTIAGAKKKLEGEIASGGPATRPAPHPTPPPAVSAPAPTTQSRDADASSLSEDDRRASLHAGLEEILAEARDLLALLDRRA